MTLDKGALDMEHIIVTGVEAALLPEIFIPALMLLGLFVLLLVILVRAQARADFDVANFLRDETGKESAMRAFAFVALAVTSWIVATLALKGNLTSDYFLYYNLTWANTVVLMKLADKWSGQMPFAKGDASPPQPT